MRGVCLDALNPFGSPAPSRLQTLTGSTGHRLTAVDNVEFYWYVKQLISIGKYPLAIHLTGASFDPTFSQYDNAYRWAKSLSSYLLSGSIWIVGNEWNVDNDASFPSAQEYTGFYNMVANGILAVDPKAQIYIGGMYSSPQLLDDLQLVLSKVNPQPTGVCLHLYEETIQQTEELLIDLHDRFYTLQVCMDEWNWNTGTRDEIVEYCDLLARLTQHSFYFCWSDGQVNPYGLVRVINSLRKPVFQYYKQGLAKLRLAR